MPIHRIIFRFDFSTNFDLLDNPGTVMKMLAKHIDSGLWNDMRENRENRQIIASKLKKPGAKIHSMFSVEPKAIFGTVESLAGLGAKKILDDSDDLNKMLELTRETCEHFKISEFQRVGLRMFYFGGPSESRDLVHRAFRSFTRSDALEVVEQSLGEISDYSLTFDGAKDDKVGYHFRAGPFEPSESARYMKELSDEFRDSSDAYSLVCDLDLYENGISLNHALIGKWFRPLWMRADEVFSRIEALSAAAGG